MDQCRLCLSKRRNLRSLYYIENGISYVDMVTSIANIKTIKEEDIPKNICLSCRKKLKEAYYFKIMIESSDLALQGDTELKKIYFNSINDIKLKAEFTDSTENKNFDKNYTLILDKCFNTDEKTICYKGTVIKKLDPVQNNINDDGSEAVSVHDFLRTFKEEPDNDYDYTSIHDYQDSIEFSDDDYNIPLKKRCVKKNHRKKSSALNRTELRAVLIKPVFMNDLRLLRTNVETKCDKKIKKKYVYKKTSMCNYCGKMSSNIKQHILTHTGIRKYKCASCTKAFFSEQSLKTHMKTHSKEKNFKCDQCMTRFRNSGSLKSHMLVHVEVKNHVCPICSKAFKRKRAMLRHIPIHSVASKTVKCDLCNMSFISKCGLKHHMRVHTGERPYRCEMCSQGYSYKHDFNRHCLKKHGVFFKRRSVNIMNEEVLQKERELMRKLMLSVNGIIKDDEPFKAFDVPQGQKALAQAIKLIESKQISVDLNF